MCPSVLLITITITNSNRKGARMKATFIKAIRNGWEHTDLMYEYRGYTYIVTRHNNGYAFDDLASQHKKTQEEIDYKIEHKDDPIPEWQYEGSAEEGFDLFLNMVEGDEFDE